MASWSEFAAASPQLAEAIRALLQQYGPETVDIVQGKEA